MFEKEIEEGVEYLNKNYPNWINQIDLDILDLQNGCDCIIGQLDYGHVLMYEDTLGFYTTNKQRWGILTDEWRTKILSLRDTAI